MDAIDIDDVVYAATGAPLRRLTAYDGTHWFPVVDVAKQLGYAGSREALRTVALPGTCLASARELAGGEEFSGRSGIRASTRMVSLQGLVQLVGACRRPEAGPFRAWTAEVIAAVQRYGGYGLEPSPVQGVFVLPPELVDVLVRLDGQFDERAVAYTEHTEYAELLRETRRSLSRVADSLERLAVPRQRAGAVVALTPQQLVESWTVTGDTHTVASCLAPALLRGGVRHRAQDVTRRTGLSADRVRECVRLLVDRGCIREVGGPDADGARIYVLP
ncbi:DNA-binding protein [Streptomyces sp. CB02009]|uniref:BRO family protein n=1 Tax=Streptomyces sp. CB02009 TaxID=1703938 RepID=UPI00093CA0D7|nr:BRO family protein [Streptomyces sp. CB02009]OKJ61171.1 DNA-binding protein [Streptomyces sp. CB02009]